jgi:hypothetical protein
VRAETAKLRAGTSDGGESQRQGNGKTTDINTDDKSSRLPPRIHLLTTISHDAGVLVAAVVAQRALQGGGDEDDVGLDADV